MWLRKSWKHNVPWNLNNQDLDNLWFSPSPSLSQDLRLVNFRALFGRRKSSQMWDVFSGFPSESADPFFIPRFRFKIMLLKIGFGTSIFLVSCTLWAYGPWIGYNKRFFFKVFRRWLISMEVHVGSNLWYNKNRTHGRRMRGRNSPMKQCCAFFIYIVYA